MSGNLKNQFNQINQLLKKRSKIAIASHENPDPDAVASVLALHNFFKKNNLQSFPYLPDNPSSQLNFLPGFFDIKNNFFLDSDILFCLDYGDFKRLRIPKQALKKNCPVIITIDHHLAGDQKGEVKIVEPEFSSTAEIIYQWMVCRDFKIDRDIASCILTGIFSDSGGFRHVSTSSATFRTVSELLSKGASLDKIVRSTVAFQPSKKHSTVSRAWGKALDRLKLDKKTRLAYSWISFNEIKSFGVRSGDFDGLTNMIAAGSPICLGLFLAEHGPGEIKGSLRSEPFGGIDVAKIAKALGGGGHCYAAGFQQKGNMGQILKKVINLIE